MVGYESGGIIPELNPMYAFETQSVSLMLRSEAVYILVDGTFYPAGSVVTHLIFPDYCIILQTL